MFSSSGMVGVSPTNGSRKTTTAIIAITIMIKRMILSLGDAFDMFVFMRVI